MALIDRYLLRQLRGPTLAATAALSTIAILTQSLTTLDIIVDQRQSTLTFLKIILLTLPQMVSMILPISLFVAALLALNRLHSDQEVVVCFAGGMSRWRVTAPAFKLAAAATVLTLFVNLWIAPLSLRQMREEVFRVRTDLAASLIREGEFTQPSAGLTVYAQSADAEGQLRNVFIDQTNTAGGSSTFTAKRGQVTKRDGQPALLLRQGSNQSFSKEGVLNFLAFDEYVFDLAPYLDTESTVHYKLSDRYLHELVFPDLTQFWERANRKKMLAEAHYRLASPLYNLTFMAMALAAVLGGGFSRLGYGRRIAAACLAAAVVRIIGFGAQAACDSSPWLNVLQYAIPLVPAWYAVRELFGSAKTARAIGSTSAGAPRLQPLGVT